jgi:tetratricopeptide (TPR) repeat protein
MPGRLNPGTRRAVSVLALALVAAYVYAAGRVYEAERLGSTASISALQRATQLEPWNPEFHSRLGRYYFFAEQDAAAAVPHYRSALALAPYVARYWFDLATAYQVTGNLEGQRQALEKAVAVDPRTPGVAWEAANFYIVQGDVQKAFPLLRVVMENDPGAIQRALQIGWRASGRRLQPMLDQVLPQRPGPLFAFLQLLVSEHQAAAADAVWSRILSMHQPFAASQAFPYFDSLMADRRMDVLQHAWRQLIDSNPELKPYLPSEGLVVNSGFEYPLLNGGLAWRYNPPPAVELFVDTSQFHGGTRSLCIEFKGPIVAEPGIRQTVPVEPDTAYRLSLFAHAEEIISTSGPRLAVQDASTGKLLLVSDDFLGTRGWSEVQETFVTGPDTTLVVLKVMRSPSNTMIKGRFWIDDVSLVRQQAGGALPQ